MRVDTEKDGVARLASDHDDHITPVGRSIRASRFDEPLQLINIFKGVYFFSTCRLRMGHAENLLTVMVSAYRHGIMSLLDIQ